MISIKILMLEDEVYHNNSFVSGIKFLNNNIIIDFVKSETEAIKKFLQNEYNLIVSDLDINGDIKKSEVFLKKVRSINKKIPIYILTGIEYEGIINENDFQKKYNIAKWLKKPLSSIEFYDEHLAPEFNLQKVE